MKLTFKGKHKWWSILLVLLAAWIASDVFGLLIFPYPVETIDILINGLVLIAIIGVSIRGKWGYYLAGLMSAFNTIVGAIATPIFLIGLVFTGLYEEIGLLLMIGLGTLLSLATLIATYKARKSFGIKGIIR